MSITVGIKICPKNPTKESVSNDRPWVSWKNLSVHMWITEWFFLYESEEPSGYYRKLGEFEWEASVLKDDLLRMADDLINRRFDVCPETYHDDIEGDEQAEDRLAGYGTSLKHLAEQLQDDEMLVYYDCGC